MIKEKNVTKNYIYNLIYQIMVMILPLITTPYLSRVIGAEGIGIYSYTLSIVTYFVLFGSLGTAMYAQREIAYVQDDEYKRSKNFWEIFILRAISITISMIIFYFVFGRKGEYSLYYKILLLEIFANIFDISAFFQGMEEFKKVIKRNLIIKVISIISIFIFIKSENDIEKYLLIYSLSTLIGNISLWWYLPKYIIKIKVKSLDFKKHIKPTIVLFIPQIATQIYTVLDKTMIGAMIQNKAEVGYYEQSQKIVKLLLTIVTSLGTVMLPRIANKFASGKKEEIKSNINTSFNFVYFLSIPMCFGIILIAKDLIPWFLGDGFEKAIYIIYVISPIILLIGLSNVIGIQYLLPTKRQKQYTLSVISGAITNLIFNLIFIVRFQSIGAAIATTIAETTVTGLQFYFIRKEYDLKLIFKMSFKYIVSSIVMFITVLFVNKIILNNLGIVTRMALDVLIGTITYLIILIILKDEFLIKYVEKLK